VLGDNLELIAWVLKLGVPKPYDTNGRKKAIKIAKYWLLLLNIFVQLVIDIFPQRALVVIQKSEPLKEIFPRLLPVNFRTVALR
jgi:hypothetical protein